MNLLEMKCAGLEKRFVDEKLPAIAAERCGVKNDRDKIKFVGGRTASQQQRGAYWR